MKSKNLFPILGMNTVSDTARQHGNYVRLAQNININPNGTVELRAGVDKVSDTPIKDLWQSPLHKDVFGRVGDEWVLVNPMNWSVKVLGRIGNAPIYHALVNNRVVVAGKNGLFEYDGQKAIPLTIPTPAPPMATGENDMVVMSDEITGLDSHTHKARTRLIAISYTVGDKEGGLSSTVKVDADTVQITLPMVVDDWVTGVNVYTTEQGGTELKLLTRLPKDTVQYTFDTGAVLGRPATNQHLSPMKSGQWLRLWRGRLLVVRSNVIYFSQALNYHLTDERFDYIAMPQRITFLEVVDNGIWVGQMTGVAFLAGVDIDEMSITHKAVLPPVVGSSTLMPAQTVGELAGGGNAVALWLSENGYCIGTADGSVVEYHAGIMDGIAGVGNTALVGQRVVSVVS